MDDVVLEFSEIEETTSVISCLASEDTTEDSGVMSSPSDIVSLNSQNDSMSSRDKSLSTQETSPEMDSMFAIETCFIRNTSFSSDDTGSIHQSSDGEQIMDTKFEDGDTFIDARLLETLAELDKDLEAMDQIHDNSEGGSLSGDMNEAPSPLLQTAEAALDISLPVPVTIIDEISEDDVAIHQNIDGESLLSRIEVNEDILVQSVSLGEMDSENGNTGTWRKGYIDGKSSCLSSSSLQQQLPNEDFMYQVEDNQKNKSDTHVPSCGEKKQDVVPEIIFKSEEIVSESHNSEDSKEKLIVSDSKFMHEIKRKEEKVRQMDVESTKEGLLSKIKTELEFRNVLAKSPEETEGSLTPSLWCHRVYSGIANYENKTGLTTFKVVPHKPEARYFERDASLSTSVIKIDELGNLVTPNAGGLRNVTIKDTISDETEETLTERAKAYWKSNSMEKQSEEPPVSHFTKTAVIKHSKSFSRMSQTRPESLMNMKTLPPLADAIRAENKIVPQKTKLSIHVTQSSPKTLTAPIVNKDKMEFPFLKPQRRTSSYYVASAIAKCIDLSQKDRCGKKETNNEKGVKTETEPPSKRNTIITTNDPVETQPTKKEESSGITSCSKNASSTQLLGAHSRNNTVNTESRDQIKSTNCYHEPHHGISSKDSEITEEECCCSLIKKIIVREIPSLSHQKKEQVASCSAPFFLKSSNAHSSTSFNTSMKSTGEHPFNRKSSVGILTVDYASSKKDEKHDDMPTKNKPESKMKDGNICHVFGPQKRFKPVTQKPIPKDTSLHSALMEAIQTAGGREKLRKISSSTINEPQKKPFLTEPVNERSVLLAAIRAYHGTSKLRKISSSASEELQRFQNGEVASENREACITEQDHNQTPFSPLPPPPPSTPSQLTLKTPKVFANKATENPGDARQALMEAIRSGSGAARLRKVPLLV